MPQEADHLRAPDRLLIDLEVEFLVQPDGPDDRKMIVAQAGVQQGRLALGRIGARHRGQQVEAAFVNKEQRALLLLCLLF